MEEGLFQYNKYAHVAVSAIKIPYTAGVCVEGCIVTKQKLILNGVHYSVNWNLHG